MTFSRNIQQTLG